MSKDTIAELNYFVGNADGRGLIRIEENNTGLHIASAPRGEGSEQRVAEIVRRYNVHAELLAALERYLAAHKLDPFCNSKGGLNDIARAAIAKTTP